MRLLPRARRGAGLLVCLTVTSATLALSFTVLPGSSAHADAQAPTDSGSVREVDLPLEDGTVTGPARVTAGKLTNLRPSAVVQWSSHRVRTSDARMLGVSWVASDNAGAKEPRAAGAPTVQVRSEQAGGWSDWKDVETEDSAPDPDTPDADNLERTFTQGLWLEEETEAIQVSVQLPDGSIEDLTAHLITPTMTPTPEGQPVGELAPESAPEPSWGTGEESDEGTAEEETTEEQATPEQATYRADAPHIVSRARWGADESIRRGPPRYVTRLQVGFLHHTVQTNSYSESESAALVRADYLYHVQSRGYDDIGYNFLVDRYGNIFEGRAGGVNRPVYGAHTGGFNHASFGVALIGNFESGGLPAATREALAKLFAWKLDLHHIDPQITTLVRSTGGGTSRYPAGRIVRLNIISGHRDVGSTACPGRHAYAYLPGLRTAVARTGLPKIYGGLLNQRDIRVGTSDRVIMGVRYSASVDWEATITAPAGSVVRRWAGSGTDWRMVWDGTTDAGEPAPSGTSMLRVKATWRGEAARPVMARINVIR